MELADFIANSLIRIVHSMAKDWPSVIRLEAGIEHELRQTTMNEPTNSVEFLRFLLSTCQRFPEELFAKAGGNEASGTVDYLEKLGAANGELKVVPLAVESMQKYLGQFASNRPDLKLICRLNKAERLVVDVQTDDNQSNGRLIHYQGDDEFYPAGVPSVRIRFAVGDEKSTAVTIRGTVPDLTLLRIGD